MRKLIFMLLAGVFLLSTGLSAKPSEHNLSPTVSVTDISCTVNADVTAYDFNVNALIVNQKSESAVVTNDVNELNKDAEIVHSRKLISWTWESVGWHRFNILNIGEAKLRSINAPPNHNNERLSFTNLTSTKASLWA